MKYRLNTLALAVNAALALSLAACGGGGGSEVATPASDPAAPVVVAPPAEPPAPVMVTLAGAVMANQAIRNAVVCVDLNANGACDADEPASARTGADGAYSVTYDSSKVSATQTAAVSLIAAMVPGPATADTTTIDASEPGVGNTAKPYVLRQVPGKAGQINPLTTLVAKGIADGMTEADSRTNVALQLKIADGKIDNYQDDPVIDESSVQDNARWMAQAVRAALEEGVALRVGNQSAAVEAAAGDLASLRYTDAANYSVRTFSRLAKAAGVPGLQNLDLRGGKTNGSATAASAAYNFAYLTPKGWTRCDGPWDGTLGAPSRSTYCGGSESVGFTVASSVAGRTMTAVVTEMQADPATNVINNGLSITNLATALDTAVFPADSNINARFNLTVAPAIFINSLTTDGRPQAEAQTLEQLIAAKPAGAVNLANAGGSLTLGLGSGNFKNLRVAFTGTTNATSGTVQFYECDLDSAQAVASNCVAKETGTYAISAVQGARVMRFAGHAPTVMNHTRVYAEVQNAPTVAAGNWVYQAREPKTETASALSIQKRLNPTAWNAMKTQLGL
jgi:hypothetical protein